MEYDVGFYNADVLESFIIELLLTVIFMSYLIDYNCWWRLVDFALRVIFTYIYIWIHHAENLLKYVHFAYYI